MAIFTPSAIVSEIRGSIKDVTFSRNRSGATIMGKAIQPASATADQVTRRAALTAGVSAWQALSDTEFLQWNNFVNMIEKTKTIRGRKKLSAYNEFLSRYMNRSVLGGLVTGFQPFPSVRMFPQIDSVSSSANTLNVYWSALSLEASCQFAIFATPPLSPGIRSFPLSAFKVLQIISPGAASGTTNIYSAYNTRHSLVAADNGKRVGIAIRAINSDNYSASELTFGSVLLTGIV